MKKNAEVNLTNIIAIFLCGGVSLLFWLFQAIIVSFIKSTFEGSGVYLLPCISLLIVLLVHFLQTQKTGEQRQSDLISLVDYILFLGTHIVIVCTIVTLLRESFYQVWYPDISCRNFSKMDIFSFLASIAGLATYTYSKIKPIWSDIIYSERDIEITQKDEKIE